MPGEHAKLSASSAHRWLHCTAAPTLEEQFPDTTSEYAAEGTQAHEWAEIAACELLDMAADFAPSIEGAPQEMREAAEAYADLVCGRYVKATQRCPDPLIALEKRVDFSRWVPDGFGTADCIIIADGTMDVIDFKYGANVKVEAEENPQMMLYALGAYAEYGDIYRIDTVRMTVHQPRMSDEPSTWKVAMVELLAWADDVVVPKAREAYDGPGTFNPSEDACQFCRARFECRTKNAQLVALFDEDDVAPALLSREELADILQRAAGMEKWLKGVKDHVQSLLLSGEPVPGWKMVAGRSDRVIKDPVVAAEKLIAAGCTESMVWRPRQLETLTNLTKLVKPLKITLEDALGDTIEKPPGKPTLVPESDKRPPYQPDEQLIAAFDN